MVKLMSLYINKELTNDDRAIFADKLLHTKYDYRDGISRKSTLRKFLSSYYGLTIAEELLNKFWQTTSIILGKEDCLISIVWGDEGEVFPVDKFARFLGKVMPQVRLEVSEMESVPRIEMLKYAYAQCTLSEIGSEIVALSSELTKDEIKSLHELRESMEGGKDYCFEHYICDTCISYNEEYPWHTEFMPTYMQR